MAKDFSKYSDEELRSMYQSNFGQSQDNQNRGLGRSVGDILMRIGGGKPDYSNLLDQQYKQAQIDSLKNRQNNLTPIIDESGNITGYQQAPFGNIKFAPVGYSPAYQDRAVAAAEASRAGVPLKEAQTQNAQQAGQLVSQAMSGQANQPSNIPPGTTVTSGGITIPLNPKLTESEQGVIGGVQGMEPMISQIEQSLNSGILESPLGDFGRTLNQLMADRQSALFTAANPRLQDLQSQLNALKKTIPFTEGGKQLTTTEKAMVMALLNISGKPNDRIMKDLNQAMQILRAKEQLAIGGRNAALQSNSHTQVNSSNHQIVTGADGKQYRIVGGDPNDPDVEPI